MSCSEELNYKQCGEAPVCLSNDFIPHHETEKIIWVLFSEQGNKGITACTVLEVAHTQVFSHKCSSHAVTNMILQVTNTEVRWPDEAQLAGYGLIYKDKKAAAQLSTSSYQQLIWYRCDQWHRNRRGRSI